MPIHSCQLTKLFLLPCGVGNVVTVKISLKFYGICGRFNFCLLQLLRPDNDIPGTADHFVEEQLFLEHADDQME
ncbi:hypothetical protein D3C75_1222650 [compost metagenome]